VTITRAEEIRLRYAAIVESSDDAIIAKTLDGVVSAWNAAAERMFGYAEHEAIGQPITMIIPPDLHAEEHEILRRLRAGERVVHYETVRVTKAGERIDVSLTISPLRDHAGRIVGCSKIARDITMAKRAEAALRESDERFRRIANAAPVMIWMSAVEKQITYLNQTWLDYTGRALEASLGQRWTGALHVDDLPRYREVYEKAFEQRERFELEHRLRRHDGEHRWVVTVGVPRYDGDGSFTGYIGTTVDITERKLAEEALSTVSQKLIEAHEEEGARIARELHDDINQRLTVVNLNLDRLKQNSSASPADLERIGKVRQQIVDLVTDIQALSHRLYPPRLEFLGLEAAAAGLCDELSTRHGITIDVHVENIPKALPPEISLSLYRVLQEALQNVVKHCASAHAHVSVSGHHDTVTMTIQDSGAGFDPQEAMRGPGLGLTSMKERLKVVGGQLSIHSQRGLGTTIHAVAPLASQRNLSTSFDN
jgi:PAS domain S-box-containing protein